MKLVAATCCTGGYECKSAFQVAVQQCGACVAGINCQRSHLDFFLSFVLSKFLQFWFFLRFLNHRIYEFESEINYAELLQLCELQSQPKGLGHFAFLPIHGLLLPSPSLPPTQCYADPSNIVPLFQHSFFCFCGLGVGEVGKFNNDIPLKNVRHQLAFCQVSQGFLARVETYTLYDLFH